MHASAYTLFTTALGTCGLAWNENGIVAVQLPEDCAAATRARLQRRAPTARQCSAEQVPQPLAQTIDDLVGLLRGERRDLRTAPLELSDRPSFHQRVYAVVREIAPGHTRSYAQVAASCGEAQAARAVGQAMACNPVPLIVPCHRVLAGHGRSGGFSAHGGIATKWRLLAIEGAVLARDDASLPTLPLPL